MSVAMTGAADDLVQPFQIEASSLRGRLVRLGSVLWGTASASLGLA